MTATTNQPAPESTIWFIEVASPIGILAITSVGGALTGLYMESHKHGPVDRDSWKNDKTGTVEVLALAKRQLREYFEGYRTTFEVPLGAAGTDAQKSVWRQLSAIPYGVTRTYGDIAKAIGNPKASRAVGAANGRNPISIIVPCHRVIGADGSLTGFGGGIERKQWLLAHEAQVRSASADSIDGLR
ncbi:MAG: methylated-DNA--[protein]-cysteine S-methyltransferase [Gemmatimonadaceae bacterium]